MIVGPALCVCGHWSDKHHEEWIEETNESFYKCARCCCGDFVHDAEGEREGRNEYRQLQYDIERGK